MRPVSSACIAVLISAVGLGCDAGSTEPAEPPLKPSPAVFVNEQNRDVTVSAFIECTGEEFALTGNLHQLFTGTGDGNGKLHLHFEQNFSGTGTSPETGISYVVHETQGDQFDGTFDAGSEHTFTITFTVVGSGSAPNSFAHAMQHIVVHPDLTVTGFFDRVRIECQ